MISQTGGHGDECFPCGFEVPLLSGPYPGKPACIVDGPDEMRRTGAELIRAGADVLKVATERGGAQRRQRSAAGALPSC